MNVHHLELFYHVARAGGIVAACRVISYGIQQPAVSAQVARLEQDLGVRLFERRPFRLTPAGVALYDFVKPFFSRLEEMEGLVRGSGMALRLAGLTEVMRGHLPEILARLQGRFPGWKVTLQEIHQRGAEKLIAEGGADLAVTVLESRLPPGFRSLTLARLPVVLVVASSWKGGKAAELLKAGAAGEVSLISLPPEEMLPKLFHCELARRGLRWRTGLETSSQELVAIYARSGLGAGLAVATPDLMQDTSLHVLPLKGFPPLPIGAFWKGKLSEAGEYLLGELRERARVLRVS